MSDVSALQPAHHLTPLQCLQLAAPHTWAASVVPALFGELWCAWRGIPLSVVQDVALLLACVLLQSAVNAINDYVDFRQGTDSAEDNVAPNDSVLVYNSVDPREALALGVAYLAFGAGLGVFSCLVEGWCGWLPLGVGCVGALAIVLYSGGPLPVSYLPLGELVSGVVMGGLIPLGIAAVADGRIHPDVLLASLPLVVGIALTMMTNNGCDIEKDVAAERHTLPTFLGRSRTRVLYHVLVIAWAALVVGEPLVLLGPVGLASLAFAAAFVGRDLVWLGRCTLAPGERIAHMGHIARANLLGNGAIDVAFALALLLG